MECANISNILIRLDAWDIYLPGARGVLPSIRVRLSYLESLKSN